MDDDGVYTIIITFIERGCCTSGTGVIRDSFLFVFWTKRKQLYFAFDGVPPVWARSESNVRHKKDQRTEKHQRNQTILLY